MSNLEVTQSVDVGAQRVVTAFVIVDVVNDRADVGYIGPGRRPRCAP
jgi:hypothetical protein